MCRKEYKGDSATGLLACRPHWLTGAGLCAPRLALKWKRKTRARRSAAADRHLSRQRDRQAIALRRGRRNKDGRVAPGCRSLTSVRGIDEAEGGVSGETVAVASAINGA